MPATDRAVKAPLEDSSQQHAFRPLWMWMLGSPGESHENDFVSVDIVGADKGVSFSYVLGKG